MQATRLNLLTFVIAGRQKRSAISFCSRSSRKARHNFAGLE
jgi:hypothetical protein